MKEFAPKESKFFPFSVDPFSEADKIFNRVASFESRATIPPESAIHSLIFHKTVIFE